ncbi:hypothetical protein GCM10007906_41240 [Vibrio hyugaensis]|uniref:BIG2 domain-containing protein n=1 Tax=Vibrio hyugaensis TaxID=1534743 RepID=A0ABQ5YAU5_9VIBR|nr:hypothetical protein [Vibrio hyugaensis]GLR06536.1 hypothetical protein GCM10007906_41240 [Vibrio hyugaensis]
MNGSIKQSVLKWILAFITVSLLSACNGSNSDTSNNSNSGSDDTSVKLLINGKHEEVNLYVGQEVSVEVISLDNDTGEESSIPLSDVDFEYQNVAFDIVAETGSLITKSKTEQPVTVIAKYNSVSSNPISVSVLSSPVAAFSLTPFELTLPVSFKEKLIATVSYSNGLTRELMSEEVNWNISDESIVSIVDGEVIGKSVGSAVVTAEYEGESAQTKVTVTDAMLDFIVVASESDNRPLPLLIESAIGVSAEIVTLGIFSDGHDRVLEEATYQIEGASVERKGNIFSTVTEGMSYVTAKYQDISSSTVVVAASDENVASVSIVTPDIGHHKMVMDRPLQLTAQMTWGELTEFEVTDVATWEVIVGHEVVKVSSDGLVTGLKVGEAVVQASLNSNLVATTSIVVRDSALNHLTISPENVKLAVSESTEYEVTAHFDNGNSMMLSAEEYSLTVDKPALVSVSQNTVTALEEGEVVVTATLKSDPQYQASASINILYKKASAVVVTLEQEAISKGEGTEASVIVKYTDGTERLLDNNNLIWYSSDTSVATVVNGYITASGDLGTTDITATYQGTMSDPVQLKVEERQLERIDLNLDDVTLSVGGQKTLTVQATYNGSEESVDNRNIVWSSTDPTIATVNGGVITTKAVGTATIEASYTHNFVTKTASVIVNVVSNITGVKISADKPSLIEGETEAKISIMKVGSLGEEIPVLQEDNITWTSQGTVNFDENSMTVTGNSGGEGTLQAFYITPTGEIHSNVLDFTVASAPAIEVEGGSLNNIKIVAITDIPAMEGNTARFQAIGVYNVDGVLVNRDISNLVNWNVNGNIKFSPSNEVGEFYFEEEGEESLSIRYGDFEHSINITVASPIPVNSRSVEIGRETVRGGQNVKLPGKGVVDLNVTLHYEDGSNAIDNSMVWEVLPQDSSVALVGNKLHIQEDNINFTLNGYSTNVVDGNVELGSTPVTSFDVEVGGVDMTLTNVELQLARANYKVGDKIQYTLYKNYASGLRDKVTDLSSVTFYGAMLDSNSLGEALIIKALSGEVYAKLNDIDEVTNSVAIEVTSDKVTSLTLTALNSDLDNYLITDSGYQFNIYSQVDNGLSEPCMTCTISVSNITGVPLGADYYAVEQTDSSSTAKVSFLQSGTYYVKAVSSDGLVNSDVIEVTVPDNPIYSIELDIEPIVSTFLGDHIKPNVTVSYTDGQTRKAGSVTYSTTSNDLIDIQGDTLYPIKSGSLELTAYYKGLSVTKNIVLQVEEVVTVQNTTLHFLRTNSLGELILDAYHKPYITMTLSNATTITYPYEDVAWTIKSSELPYEQTLQGFRFFYKEEYFNEYAFTEFVGSIYFNGELYQAERKISADSRITSGLWIGTGDWSKVDEIKVGESVELIIRRGFHLLDHDVYYDLLSGTKAAPSNNNVKILSENDYGLVLEGESVGPVTVYFYSQYGEFLDSEDFNVVE